jgi:PD-(D/E)XK endonuclease
LTNHPVEIGQRTEAAILAELVRRGYRVLIPFGVNQRYDLVLDHDGKFIRVQCKTARLRRGAIHFSTRSVRSNTRRTVTQGYAGGADLFLAYCPETDRIYAVHVEEAPDTDIWLRVDPTRNGQARGIRWAKDYELPA